MRRVNFIKIFTAVSFFLTASVMFSQTAFYGGRTEITVNNPTYTTEDLIITNSPIFKLGAVGGRTFDNIDLSLEAGALIGFERLQWDQEYEGVWTKTMDASNMSVEIPLAVKKRFSIENVPLKPMITAGYYIKLPLSRFTEKDPEVQSKPLKSYEVEHGLNVGAGVNLFSYFELGVTYRYIVSDTWGVGRWLDPSTQHKNQIIVSLAVLFNK
ncbi:MAG: hypothetical protein ACOX19_07510 [Fermentimonas sp.]|jgi:hypothetical protein